MSQPQTLREQLMRDEGLRLKAYQDQVGKWTIGVGRNLQDKGISLAEAETLLDNDIRDAASDVQAHLPWTFKLDDVRREVLVGMAFNLGIAGLLGFKRFLAAVEAGDWAQAAQHGLDSKWHRQVGLRAERLMQQLVSGERQ